MADGQPIIIGQANPNTGQTRTSLNTNAQDATLEIGNNLGVPAPVAIYGQCQEGTGIRGLSGVISPVPAVTPETRAGLFGTSIDRVGVVGESESNTGVRGDSRAADPGFSGVLGVNAGSGNGVQGNSRSESASGVYGQNDAGGFGVAGRTGGAQPAVWGDNTGSSGNGVQGNSRSASASGVYGQNDAGGFGVAGRTDGAQPAVWGDNTGGGVGVEGRGGRVGVRGDGRGPGGSGIGVEGIPGPLSGGFIPWAGAFRGSVLIANNASIQGDLFVSGTKSAVVRHPDGSDRALYAIESPDNWFEDFGRAELTEGHARVELDADFAAIAQPGADYHVFVTPEGESTGLFVTNRTASGFDVHEQQGGVSRIRFSYRVVTRRKDVEARRLATVELPPSGMDEEPPGAPDDSTRSNGHAAP